MGSRLAFIRLPPKYNYIPIIGAILYGITTPIGIAAGLGVRETYNPDSTTANLVSGILDAFSSGILLYTGLVEVRARRACPLLARTVLTGCFSSSRTSSCSTRTCCRRRTSAWRTRSGAWSSAQGSWRCSGGGHKVPSHVSAPRT